MPPQQDEESTRRIDECAQEPLLSSNDDQEIEETVQISPKKDVHLPVCWGDEQFLRVNHNVFLNLLLAVLYGISCSLSTGTAYAAYLQKLGHDRNSPFGDIEAVYGLATLVTALPVGIAADRLGRSKVIFAGGLLLLGSTLVQAGIINWVGTSPSDKQTHIALWLFGGMNVFWGIGEGVVDGPCSALFADSTPQGERSKYYNYLFICSSAASAVGPLVSIILFQTLGDEWSIDCLRIVMLVGLGMEVFNACIMLLYDDKKALEAIGNESSINPDDDSISDEQNIEGDSSENVAGNETAEMAQAWIPYIIFAQDLIASIGSGMTIKFFPLFFKDEIGMTPSQVQVIFCITPLAMAVTSTLGSKLASSGFGRVQTQLLFSILGVSCLYGMVFFQEYLSRRPLWLVPIYVARTSLMNGSYPLQESILMDFVPKGVRGRWKSLDSVASFGWCGSAALGGWLADKYDYTYTFLITAILQSVAIGVWALLLPLVPRTEGTTNHPVNNSTPTTQDSVLEQIIPLCDNVTRGFDEGEASLQELLEQPLLSVE